MDDKKTKRRLIFHSGTTKGISINHLHARIPIGSFLRDKWVNISIDVFAFAHFCFKGVNVQSIELIQLTSTCKLRKIFTMKAPLMDDEMNDNQNLIDALNQLCFDEFGGDMNQIQFEPVPHQLSTNCAVEFRNQFVFPQRITMGAVSSLPKGPEALLSVEGKSLSS